MPIPITKLLQPVLTGNPGFELEIVLETNFRVAAYNVDGTSSPTLINSYSINTNSQISVALSTASSTLIIFIDFYVPVSAWALQQQRLRGRYNGNGACLPLLAA